MIRKLYNLSATIMILGLTTIACVGSWRSHIRGIPVNLATIPYEADITIPEMIELNPEADYVASDKSDIYRYNPYLEWTDREKDLLIRVSQAEAGNQGTVGMALVMRVVLNRVEKNGTDIETEIFETNQFAVSGMAPGTWENYEALDMVQNGWDESQGAIYFCSEGWNFYGDEHLFKYGDHWFSK